MKNLIMLFLVLLSPFVWAVRGISDKVSTGMYWVPVGQQLSQFALFTIPEVKVRIEKNVIRIEYELPQELTGTTNKVEFEGTRPATGPMTLFSGYGKMECPSANDLSNCAVTYGNLQFDAGARTALLKSISTHEDKLNEDELNKRELVAARFQFGGEPHGFLRVLP